MWIAMCVEGCYVIIENGVELKLGSRLLGTSRSLKLFPYTGTSEGPKQTKHWRGKPLFTKNGLPLQCFVSSEPSDAPAPIAR